MAWLSSWHKTLGEGAMRDERLHVWAACDGKARRHGWDLMHGSKDIKMAIGIIPTSCGSVGISHYHAIIHANKPVQGLRPTVIT